jgi:formylglycine-generating enzyme required for sulfatase activity
MKRDMLIGLAVLTSSAAFALPQVEGVALAQRQGSRTVEITYSLAGTEPAIITLGIETNGIALPDEAVTEVEGDVCALIQPGADKRIVWRAGTDWPEHVTETARARVTAWATNAPPPYLVVDLSGGPSGTNYPVRYYPSAGALPHGGLSNDVYKTVLMAFRYVRAGPFWMGASPFEPAYLAGHNGYLHRVTLTNDFFIGVYEVTQAQWCQVAGTKPSGWNYAYEAATRPAELVSYLKIRECDVAANTDTAIDWPLTGNTVGEGSFADRLRRRTGLSGFDLPTDAQWEYAARAGTLRSINVLGGINVTNVEGDANMDLAGRYKYNGGWGADSATEFINQHAVYGPVTPATYATAKVGSYLPNAWGLYDMQGNVSEWARDRFVANLGSDPVVEPVGPTSGDRVVRGMSFWHSASASRISARLGWGGANAGSHVGFRMACVWQ